MNKIFLLVDDDTDDSELFSQALEEVDPSIIFHYASDGQEALDLLKEIKEPSLIFLDINMPGMNGWECLVELKGKDAYKNIPVVMYSTSSHQREIDIAYRLGALCFFTKPYDYKELKRILKIVVEKMDENSLISMCQNTKNLSLL